MVPFLTSIYFIIQSIFFLFFWFPTKGKINTGYGKIDVDLSFKVDCGPRWGKGTVGSEGWAPSDRELANCQKRGWTGHVIPLAICQDRHTVFSRASIVGLMIIPIYIGYTPSCQIHKLTFIFHVCEAQEGHFSGYILDGPVLFIIHGGGHRGPELGAQILRSIKGHTFTTG